MTQDVWWTGTEISRAYVRAETKGGHMRGLTAHDHVVKKKVNVRQNYREMTAELQFKQTCLERKFRKYQKVPIRVYLYAFLSATSTGSGR